MKNLIFEKLRECKLLNSFKKITTAHPWNENFFQVTEYINAEGHVPISAIHLGTLDSKAILTRIHSKCFYGDTIGFGDCDCREQLQKSLQMISTEEAGLIIYMHDAEGRGIGHSKKAESILLEQTENLDTVDAFHRLGYAADLRDYNLAVEVIKDLGVTSVRLITNNPQKINAVTKGGIEVIEIINLHLHVSPHAVPELLVKRDKLGHMVDI